MKDTQATPTLEITAKSPVLLMAMEVSAKKWKLCFGDGSTRKRLRSVPEAGEAGAIDKKGPLVKFFLFPCFLRSAAEKRRKVRRKVPSTSEKKFIQFISIRLPFQVSEKAGTFIRINVTLRLDVQRETVRHNELCNPGSRMAHAIFIRSE